MSYDIRLRSCWTDMAAVRADELDTELVCLAVWSWIGPATGLGGTAINGRALARAMGRNLRIIDLEARWFQCHRPGAAGVRTPRRAD